MNTLLIPEIRETLQQGNVQAIREFVDDLHDATIAEFIEALDPPELAAFLQCLKPLDRGEVFSYFDVPTQIKLAQSLKRDQLAELVTHMSPDERADLVKRLPQETLEALLPALAQAERDDIRRLVSYEEGTAGAAMTSDYVALTPDLTAGQAIDLIRKEAPDRETVYYAYIITARRNLIGAVSLKDLILARPNSLISDFMQREPIFANTDEDQEEVVRKIEKYDLLAIPIVDKDRALVGIVTHDDAFDIVREEQTEDIERLMGITGEAREEGYLDTPALIHFRRRASWIAILAVLGLVSGWIIHKFESTLSTLVLLAIYMPMLADTGGNAGAQTSSVVIRALALRQISTKDVFRIIAKELLISGMLGLMVGVLAFGKVLFLSRESVIPEGFTLTRIGVTVSLALAVQVVSSAVIGALLPLGASKMRLDPAVVASPALTTVVDITGLLLYFSLAHLVLGI